MSALQQTVLIDHPSMQFKLADMPLLVALIKSSVFTVQVKHVDLVKNLQHLGLELGDATITNKICKLRRQYKLGVQLLKVRDVKKGSYREEAARRWNNSSKTSPSSSEDDSSLEPPPQSDNATDEETPDERLADLEYYQAVEDWLHSME